MRLLRRCRQEENHNEWDSTIEFLRSLSQKSYEKLIKIAEIYRKADEDAKVVELGSKKAVREQEKEAQDLAEINGIEANLREDDNE